MTDARAALRDRVAEAICRDNRNGNCPCESGGMCLSRLWDDAASATIDLVLEEAAKVAEAYPASTHGALATAPYAAAEQAADEIAAAIRALKSKP